MHRTTIGRRDNRAVQVGPPCANSSPLQRLNRFGVRVTEAIACADRDHRVAWRYRVQKLGRRRAPAPVVSYFQQIRPQLRSSIRQEPRFLFALSIAHEQEGSRAEGESKHERVVVRSPVRRVGRTRREHFKPGAPDFMRTAEILRAHDRTR